MKYDAPIKDMMFLLTEFIGMEQIKNLPGNEEIGRHIQEYLLRPGLSVPAVIKVALKGANLGKLAMMDIVVRDDVSFTEVSIA